MGWTVTLSHKANKLLQKLPEKVQLITQLLVHDLQMQGPFPGKQWPNYGKLSGKENNYHCHLIKGKPTYVSCWEVVDKRKRLIEVYYVGTHENAPY